MFPTHVTDVMARRTDWQSGRPSAASARARERRARYPSSGRAKKIPG